MYTVFGSCKDVNIGPTAIMALMTQPHVEKLGPDMAVLLSFLSGCIIFVLGLLQLGKKLDSLKVLLHHHRSRLRTKYNLRLTEILCCYGFVLFYYKTKLFLR